MTNFLVQHFVPNAHQVTKQAVRERYGILAGSVGIVCNSALFLLKLVVGILTHSISITADAINNLSDGLSSLISIIGFKLSGKEPDENHPFGYGRTEYIAGFLVSFLILQVGYAFLKSSFLRVLHPQPIVFHAPLITLLVISLLVKLWMGTFNRTIGRRIQSPALLAAMQDSINDVIATSVVILGSIASQFTALPIDGYIGILVALFILWSGVNIARDTLGPLLGEAADPAVTQQIEQIIRNMDGILGVHDLIVHNYGVGKSLASLHAEVPDDVDFIRIHETIDEAEKLVWQKTGVYLVIHMDPISVNDERVNALRDLVNRLLYAMDERLSMHDFRIVNGEHRINLIFDVVVPFDYKGSSREILKQEIQDALQQHDKRFYAVVTIDHQM